MSSMEWNAKCPLQWDWENLIMFNATAAENPQKMQQAEWEMDGDGGIDSASFFSLGGGNDSGGSSSDVGFASLSKSSKSASNTSSSMGETKTSKFNLEAFDDIPEYFDNKKEISRAELIGGSPTHEASVGFGEPLLGLKLGKRMYFEDVSAGSSAKNLSLPAIPASSVTPAKISRSNCQTIHAVRCQVEGCNLNLSSAKDYHRKHRICENHSKCPKVIVSGLERRFCQQCSRFHDLSEFDEKKRSCRRRLSDHNARRRKPQPEVVRINPAKLCSLLSGPEESVISFNLGAAQDCHRALSLLSTTSWGLCEPKQVSREHPMNTSDTNMPQTVMPAMAQGSAFASLEYRQTGKQSTECQVHPLSLHHYEGNCVQGIQLFRAPYGSDFYSYVD